jgi:acyl-CoA dehydrogenase
MELVEGIRAFVNAEVRPRHEKYSEIFDDPRQMYDETGRYSETVQAQRREIRLASAEAGFYQMFTPEELGGGAQNAVTWYAIWEDLHHQNGLKYWMAHDIIAHWAFGPSAVLLGLTPEARAKVLPDVMSGALTLCFGMSEPDAGSDIWRMQTRAVPDGDGWVINGTKQWTSNGPYADYSMIFAVTDPEAVQNRKGGISAFLVPTDTPGFQIDSVIKLFGHIGGNEAIMSLTDVHVSKDYLVGELDQGLTSGLSGIGSGHLFNAGKAVGLARWALEQGVEYAKERVTFGRKLMDHQAVAFALAESAMEILPAHLLGLHAAELHDKGGAARKEIAMAKANSVEMAARTLECVIQTMGGMGFTNEMGLTEVWQELRLLHIGDGSAQMQRRIVAGRLAAGDFDL